MSPRYNLRNIRTVLTEGFTDEELRRLCYDISDFRPIYDQLARNTSKVEIIDRLVEYADRRLQMRTILNLVKEYNPTRYEMHRPYYEITPPKRQPNLRNFRCWLSNIQRND